MDPEIEHFRLILSSVPDCWNFLKTKFPRSLKYSNLPVLSLSLLTETKKFRLNQKSSYSFPEYLRSSRMSYPTWTEMRKPNFRRNSRSSACAYPEL